MEPNQMQEKSNGALVGSIIIIIILILGGIYFWKTSMKEKPLPPAPQNSIDLEADLNNVDVENLDSEI